MRAHVHAPRPGGARPAEHHARLTLDAAPSLNGVSNPRRSNIEVFQGRILGIKLPWWLVKIDKRTYARFSQKLDAINAARVAGRSIEAAGGYAELVVIDRDGPGRIGLPIETFGDAPHH